MTSLVFSFICAVKPGSPIAVTESLLHLCFFSFLIKDWWDSLSQRSELIYFYFHHIVVHTKSSFVYWDPSSNAFGPDEIHVVAGHLLVDETCWRCRVLDAIVLLDTRFLPFLLSPGTRLWIKFVLSRVSQVTLNSFPFFVLDPSFYCFRRSSPDSRGVVAHLGD